MLTLGNKLQLLRKSRGMSQEQLAEELGVSRQAVSKWELDATLPDTANVIALSRIFGVTTDYLLMEKTEERGDAPDAEIPRRKINWRMIAGTASAGFGALGIFVLFIVSRFVKVMVPVYTINDGVKRTHWNSSHTDVNFRYFVDEYHLEGLIVLFALLIAAGVIMLLWDKYISGWVKRVRE